VWTESKCIFIPVGKFLSVYYSTIGVSQLAPEKVIGVVRVRQARKEGSRVSSLWVSQY